MPKFLVATYYRPPTRTAFRAVLDTPEPPSLCRTPDEFANWCEEHIPNEPGFDVVGYKCYQGTSRQDVLNHLGV